MQFSKTVETYLTSFKSFFIFCFCCNYLLFYGCFAISSFEGKFVRDILPHKRDPVVPRLHKRTASSSFTLVNRSVLSVVHEPSNLIGESKKFYSDLDVPTQKRFPEYYHNSNMNSLKTSPDVEMTGEKFDDNTFSLKRRTHSKSNDLKGLKSLRKNHRSKGRGRKKNLEENLGGLIVGMREYEVDAINTNKITEKQLCPEWPRDSKMVVNCSNGRQIRSLCLVDCAPGYKLKDGSPNKRRCLKNARKQGTNPSIRQKPSWSGRDHQFVCGRWIILECFTARNFYGGDTSKIDPPFYIAVFH